MSLLVLRSIMKSRVSLSILCTILVGAQPIMMAQDPGMMDPSMMEVSQLPLIQAITSKNTEKVKELLAKGIDVNLRNNYGQTALMEAVYKRSPQIVKMLLEVEGINVNLQDVFGKTALIEAIYSTPAIVKMLLEVKGINVNLKDTGGRSALTTAVLNGDPRIVKMLLEAKGIDDVGTTLMTAVYRFDDKMITFLLDNGVDVNFQNKDGNTALMATANILPQAGARLVKVLLEAKGINVNLQNKSGITALMRFAAKGQAGIIKMLLEAGADASLKNDAGKTAYDLAKTQAVKQLLEPTKTSH